MTTMENLLTLLPQGWESACFDTHAILRKRKIKNPQELMQLSLLYLLENYSLMETCEAASILGMILSRVVDTFSTRILYLCCFL